MKIVVTGADGFIGGHLCRVLDTMGHAVTGIDIKSGRDIFDCVLPNADLVFHLAAQTDAANTDAAVDARLNIMGLLRILQRYRSAVVFASSSMVNYPVTPYAISKLAGEHYCKLFGASVARLCNVYGPGGHSVIDRFEADPSLTIYGDGSQVRTYAHVDSAVTLLMMECTQRAPLRVLPGRTLSVSEIAGRHPDKPRRFLPARAFDPIHAAQVPV